MELVTGFSMEGLCCAEERENCWMHGAAEASSTFTERELWQLIDPYPPCMALLCGRSLTVCVAVANSSDSCLRKYWQGCGSKDGGGEGG